MKIKTAYSTSKETQKAVDEIQQQLSTVNASLILYFVSSEYDPTLIAKKMQLAYPNSQTIGCTTAGEIITGKMLDKSIVAMAFDKNLLEDFNIRVATDIDKSMKTVDDAFQGFSKHFGIAASELDHTKFVGLVLIDGLSGCEELVNEAVGDRTNISFIGGSAGDDMKFEKTWIFANGKAYTNAVLLAVLKPQNGFSILKTQSFKTSNKILKVTKAIANERKVTQFNKKPAVQAYSEALEVPVSELSKHLFKHPLGLLDFQNQPFVRSPRVIEQDSICFYCNILEGAELHLLQSTDIIKDTKAALQDAVDKQGPFSAIINFHCILRTLDLQQQNKMQEYGKLFTNIPTIGFSTYGESYIGHINQTSTMLLLK